MAVDPAFVIAEGDDSIAAPPRTLTRPFVLGEVAIIAVLLFVYDRIRSLAEVHTSVAISHGQWVLDVERALHIDVEHAVNIWTDHRNVLERLAVDYYQYMHITVALTILVVCYVRFPQESRPARNALLLTNAIGLAVFATFPTAPPRLLPHAGFVDSVAAAGFGTNHGPIPADQYGAMPSLHLAWATWGAVTVFAMTRRAVFRVLVVAHVVITGIFVVATGNHYVLDVVTGVTLGLLATAAFANGRSFRDWLPRRSAR